MTINKQVNVEELQLNYNILIKEKEEWLEEKKELLCKINSFTLTNCEDKKNNDVILVFDTETTGLWQIKH